MAFGQYSRTGNISDMDENSTATNGSSSFSSWNSLLNSKPRPRALGRRKITAVSFQEQCQCYLPITFLRISHNISFQMPQRMCKINVEEEDSTPIVIQRRYENCLEIQRNEFQTLKIDEFSDKMLITKSQIVKFWTIV